MWPDLAKWIISVSTTNIDFGPKRQNDFDITIFIFLHKFSFAYDYFQILKLCDIEIDVHGVKNILNIYSYFNFSSIYTWISDVTMVTVAYE